MHIVHTTIVNFIYSLVNDSGLRVREAALFFLKDLATSDSPKLTDEAKIPIDFADGIVFYFT